MLLVVAATALTSLLWPHNANIPFAFFYLAIFVAAILGHLRAGIVALVLGAGAVNYYFIPPLNAFALTPDGFLAMGLFAGVAATFLGLIHRMRVGELRVRESERRLRTVTDTAGVGLVIVDTEHRYRYANRAYAEILSLPVDSLVGRRVADVLAPVYESQIRPRLEEALRGVPVSYELRLPPRAPRMDDRFYAVSYEPGRDLSGPIAVVVVTDITARKVAEETRARLSGIVRSSSDAIIGKSLEGKITSWNGGAEKIFGYTEEEAIGEPMLILFPPEYVDEEREILTKIARGETVPHFETRRLRKDGSQLDVAVTISPVQDGEGRIIGASKIARDITEQKQAANALRESEELFSAAFRFSPAAIAINRRADLIILEVNDSFLRMFECRRTDIVGRTLIDAGVLETATLQALRRRLSAGDSVVDEAIEARTHTGRPLHISVSVNVIQLRGETCALSTSIDITERKQAEAESARRLLELQLILDSVPALVFYKDREGRFLRVNRELSRLLGVPPEDFIGRTDTELGSPEGEHYREDDLRVMASGEPIRHLEEQIITPNGPRWVLTDKFAHRDEAGRITGLVGFAIDITERKEAEKARRESEARLNSTLMAGSIGTWTWDIPGDRLSADEFTARMFSIEKDAAARGLPAAAYLQAVHEEDQASVTDALTRAIESCGEYDIEYRVRRLDDDIRWLQARGRVECDGAGQASYFHGAVMDVTERKRAAVTLRETEKERALAFEASRLKSEFLANMSHELRTPLNCIIGFTEFLVDERPGPLNAKQKEYLTDVHNSSQHLLQLINDVLDLAKVEAGKSELHAEEFPLARAIEEVCAVGKGMAQKRQVNLVWTISPELGVVRLDQQKLKQICFNLLSNAVKFTDANGRVEINALLHGDDQFELRVKDTGIGIKEADLQRLFQEFEQLDTGHARRFEGTGLGLALTKKLVELQGGRMVVQSEFGKGSTFTAILPTRITEAPKT